jgi:heat shock protein HslJ/uncharacterized lipoprotein YbaY
MPNKEKAALRNLFGAATLAAVVALATACGSQATASGPKATSPGATAAAVETSKTQEQRLQLTEETVRNGKYELPDIGTCQLQAGNYQEKYGEGATQVKKVGLVTVAFGDLDGDSVQDAAVVLWVNTGGSGTFMYLAPLLNKGGTIQQAGVQFLGDRVQITALAVETGKIRATILSQGSGAAMINPSQQSVQEYAVQGGKLLDLTPATATVVPTAKPTQQSVPPTTTASGRPTNTPAAQPPVAPAGPTGTIWIWQRFVSSVEKDSFLLPFPAAYRLELLPDGNFAFQADCNTGSGSYAVAGSRLTLNLGPMTLAECQPGSKYGQFVQMLGQVATYVVKDDALTLNLKMDGGDLVFGKLYSVTGKIVGPAGDTLPDGATAEVMIVNNAGAQIGGSIVKAQLPMQFEAPYKPANIDPAATYTLQVTIKDAQKNVIFKNSRPSQVLTQGNPGYHLEVAVERVR